MCLVFRETSSMDRNHICVWLRYCNPYGMRMAPRNCADCHSWKCAGGGREGRFETYEPEGSLQFLLGIGHVKLEARDLVLIHIQSKRKKFMIRNESSAFFLFSWESYEAEFIRISACARHKPIGYFISTIKTKNPILNNRIREKTDLFFFFFNCLYRK